MCCFKSTAIGQWPRMLTFRGETQTPRMGVRGSCVLWWVTSSPFFQTQLPLRCFSVISGLTFSQGSHTAPSTWGHWGGNPKVENSPALFLVRFLLPSARQPAEKATSFCQPAVHSGICCPAELPAAWDWPRGGSLWKDFPRVPGLAVAEVLGWRGEDGLLPAFVFLF